MTQLGLIPSPVTVESAPGAYEMPRRIGVEGPRDDIDRFMAIVGPGAGLVLDAEAATAVRLDRSGMDAGAYELVVNADGVRLSYGDDAGLVSSIATFRQLLPAWTFGTAPLPGAALTIPHVRIDDRPRFGWRGQHLDVARHFMPLDMIYRLVDTMHLHKLNVLHLHLTDDQGWRFPVSALPKLTEAGAARDETRPYFLPDADGTPHGGYYTHDQLRALVGYAGQRGIDVVPEIDLPGHVRALLAVYPQYGEGDAQPVATGFGIFEEVLHLTDETMAMVRTVVDELMAVFPSRYIHLGGDECPKEQWRRSEAAAALAEERGLGSVDDLQRWFTEQMYEYVTSQGRVLVGWDEILDEGPLPGALAMAWRRSDEVARTAAQGNEMIVCESRRLYFDYYQSDSGDEPLAIGGHTTWQDVLAYDPLGVVPEDKHGLVKGVQCQLWTEYMPTASHVEYMAHPRQAAFAEIAWAATAADADAFADRLAIDLERLDARGISYRPLDGPRPWQQGGTGRKRRPDLHRYQDA